VPREQVPRLVLVQVHPVRPSSAGRTARRPMIVTAGRRWSSRRWAWAGKLATER